MMKNQVEEMEYETPEVKMIEVEVEQGFAVSGGNLENPRYNDEEDLHQSSCNAGCPFGAIQRFENSLGGNSPRA